MDKITKEQQFFIDNSLYFASVIYDRCEVQINPLYKMQKENRDHLLSEIATILLSYTIVNNIMSLGASEKKKLYSELSSSINEKFKLEINLETSTTKDILFDATTLKYSTNDYISSFGIDYHLTQVDDGIFDKIINTKIDNELWSDRLWTNKNDLAKDLKVQVKKFLKGEINVNDIEKVVKSKYNANAYNSKRLINTEVAKVQSGANEHWAKEHNIKQQLFLATLDNKTSVRCRGYDGQVFDVDDADKPIPPLHPHCRSCLVNLPGKEWKPKMRLDNETKQNINWQSYEGWNKNKNL